MYCSWEGIVKADSNGIEEWKNESHTVGAYPFYEDAIEHSNGSYYAVGGPGAGQAQFVKFSSTGSVLNRRWFGSECEDDIFRSIIEAPDGMLMIAGEKVMVIKVMIVHLILCITKIFGWSRLRRMVH